MNSKAEWDRNSIPRQKTVIEEEIEPQLNTEERGVKRGILWGKNEKGDILTPGSGTTADFDSQFTQRKRRKGIARRQIEAENDRIQTSQTWHWQKFDQANFK